MGRPGSDIYNEGHGTQENLAGRTFNQPINVDTGAYNLYGEDANSRQLELLKAGRAEKERKAQQAQATLEQYQMAHHGDSLVNDEQFHHLQQMASGAQYSLDQDTKLYEDAVKRVGPSKFDQETGRMLGAADAAGGGEAFTKMAGPYLDALEKSRGEMQGATDLYQTAAEGKGPSAAQNQFQSALDQSARQQMGRAGAMRGGALNQVSAQRDAAMAAGQQEAQASAGSAALRAQEMQAAMQGYAQSASQMGALDQKTAGMAAQTNAEQQRFYEQLRQGAFGQQAQMNMGRAQAESAAEQQQRAWDQAISDATHKRQNEAGQAVMGMVQGGMQAAGQIGGAMITGGATTAAAGINAAANAAARAGTSAGAGASAGKDWGF